MPSVDPGYIIERLGKDGYDCAAVLQANDRKLIENFGQSDGNDTEKNRANLEAFFEAAQEGKYLVKLYKSTTIGKRGALSVQDEPKLMMVTINGSQSSGGQSGPEWFGLLMQQQREMAELRIEMTRKEYEHRIEAIQGSDNNGRLIDMVGEWLKLAKTGAAVKQKESPIKGIDDSRVSKALLNLKTRSPELYEQYAEMLIQEYGEN